MTLHAKLALTLKIKSGEYKNSSQLFDSIIRSKENVKVLMLYMRDVCMLGAGGPGPLTFCSRDLLDLMQLQS